MYCTWTSCQHRPGNRRCSRAISTCNLRPPSKLRVNKILTIAKQSNTFLITRLLLPCETCSFSVPATASVTFRTYNDLINVAHMCLAVKRNKKKLSYRDAAPLPYYVAGYRSAFGRRETNRHQPANAIACNSVKTYHDSLIKCSNICSSRICYCAPLLINIIWVQHIIPEGKCWLCGPCLCRPGEK